MLDYLYRIPSLAPEVITHHTFGSRKYIHARQADVLILVRWRRPAVGRSTLLKFDPDLFRVFARQHQKHPIVKLKNEQVFAPPRYPASFVVYVPIGASVGVHSNSL